MTDDSGIAKIDLIGDPTVAVVIYADVLLTTEIAQRDSSTLIHMQKILNNFSKFIVSLTRRTYNAELEDRIGICDEMPRAVEGCTRIRPLFRRKCVWAERQMAN